MQKKVKSKGKDAMYILKRFLHISNFKKNCIFVFVYSNFNVDNMKL